MQAIGSILRASYRRMTMQTPVFLEPEYVFGQQSRSLPPIEPDDRTLALRLAQAEQEGLVEGYQLAYREMQLRWRNRYCWRRLVSPDCPDDRSRLQHVFWPVIEHWTIWRIQKNGAGIPKAEQAGSGLA